MVKDNRRIITWSHIESNPNYRNNIKNYNNKIYSIGLHEFGVRSNGKIYDYNTGRDYFDVNGNHTGIRFPAIIEQDMLNYPHIKWFMQFNIFGWSTVKPFLDNNVRNSEGRLPREQFFYELEKILDLYQRDRYSNTPLVFTGVEMDVEASLTSDPVSQGYDEKYVRFLEELKNRVLIPRGLKLRINAHAMWGDNIPYYYRFHNYKKFAESTDSNGNATLDEIQIMTYDFAWSGSSAGASTPIWWFEQVAEWCLECFDPKRNPKAKLTMDNVFLGAAGYGHRWGMHSQDVVKSGTNVTYHQMLGWQNGYFKHYTREQDESGQTMYVYHNQPYIFQTSFQDEESKNEVMYPHVYDRFVPKYAKILEIDNGSNTATIGIYNRLDFATSYFKQQIPKWRNIVAIANMPTSISGKAYPVQVHPDVIKYAEENMMRLRDLPDEMRQRWDDNLDPNSPTFKHVVKTVDGENHVFVGWYTEDLLYVEKYIYDDEGNVTGAVCELEDKEEGRITYEVNVPRAGNYKVVAITSFSWYTQATLGGYVNGNQRFTIGGDNIPEWYPFFLRGSHFYDCGTFSFNAGKNTISIHGELSAQNTPIFGFVVCEDFNQNFSGGTLKFKANITPFLDKEGNPAPIPKKFAIAAKMLRRDARPAILWDDEFRTYGEGTVLTGHQDPLLDSTYYRGAMKDYSYEGGGDIVRRVGEQDGQPVFKCFSPPQDIGYSKGLWRQEDDGTGRQAVRFNSNDSGQLVLSKQWTVNLSIETRIKVVRGGKFGVRFYAQKAGTANDGYIFLADLDRREYRLIYENAETGELRTVASQPLGSLNEGDTTTLRVLLHDGVGRFYVSDTPVFVAGSGNPVSHDGSVDTSNGSVTLQRRRGACGVYAENAEIFCYHLGIGTLDRWETMEKFAITIDGERREFGRINRTGYQYDEYGYLIYSGFDETVTRDEEQYPFEEDKNAVSLDYEITVSEWDGWEGEKEIELELTDAGVWFGELLIGDREGMSIIWVGDAWSIIELMNLAVDKYGAKGLGLWALGQEDPNIWEMIPDVPNYKD